MFIQLYVYGKILGVYASVRASNDTILYYYITSSSIFTFFYQTYLITSANVQKPLKSHKAIMPSIIIQQHPKVRSTVASGFHEVCYQVNIQIDE